MDDENENNQENAESPQQLQKEDAGGGPGETFKVFLQMEELLDKLKILNYDGDFLQKSAAYKPLSR